MIKDFKALKLMIASPQQIMNWSFGEVRKAETINYRTHRPEVDGLMDEKIFGPTKNFECYCGKYKKIRYKGIICDKCGVEVTHKRVRRERMGHIKLAAPVTHVWFAHGVPNKLAIILGITQKKLETVIYFARYLVTSVNEEQKLATLNTIKEKKEADLKANTDELNAKIAEVETGYAEKIAELRKNEEAKEKLDFKVEKINNDQRKDIAKIKSVYTQKETNLQNKFKDILTLVETMSECSTLSEEDLSLLREFGTDFFEAEMGAEAIQKVLVKINVEELLGKLSVEAKETKSIPKRRKLVQRIRVIEGMKLAGLAPSWLILDVLPVIPPDLRPIIQLPGGRFATSDLNDLYRRVINRNNRLKRLVSLGAPEIILRNEKRMLQESVDALVDNDHRPGNPVLNSRGLPYKSLSDMLRGKQGRFRQNLLGKRVDYSGRSVIVSGPALRIDQCGLPKTMALELFKPFVLRQIIVEGLAPNIKSAKLFFESKAPEVFDLLEKVIEGRPVLLNRAPTLHKQGIQAFFPTLIEGNAIQLHPMVCRGFNADFDGDQMAVHLPLSEKAIQEAKDKMFTRSNILLMADGNPVINVEKDMALGVYYVTGMEEKEHPKFVASENEAISRLQNEELALREEIIVLLDGKLTHTTVGRIVFNQALPTEAKTLGFFNSTFAKGDISKLSGAIFNKFGGDVTVEFLNNIERLGFKFATESALTMGMEDFVVSPNKNKFLAEIDVKEDQLTHDYYDGLITEEERKRLFEKLWMDMIEKIATDTWAHYKSFPNNNLVTLQESGAVPVQNPLRQISGVRGLILDPSGNIVQLPLRSNYKEGLSALEYFVAARGTRKGLADTALKTAESGYLTRRLCDVAQDIITKEEDCGSKNGITLVRSSNRRIAFVDRITGRVAAENIVDTKTGEILHKQNEMITPELAKIIDAAGVNDVKVRSVMTCVSKSGVCQKCYGYNLGTKRLVDKGVAVGIIAAQSMGEAATQLTLNTKHLSGRAGTDITQGLPRVEELFEARTPKAKAIIAGIDGTVSFIKDDADILIGIKIMNTEAVQRKFTLEENDVTKIVKSKSLKEGDVIYTKANGDVVKAVGDGKAVRKDKELIVIMERTQEEEYEIVPNKDHLIIEEHANVIKGQPITEGSLDPKELMDKTEIDKAQLYLIDNIQETYGIQGIAIDDKHVEVIVRQMSKYVKVTETGESDYLPGNFVERLVIDNENASLKSKDLKPAHYDRQLVGITIAAIKTESFLSASSFEQQVRVLSDAAITGKVDYLRGLKENVIIGRTVPLGDEVR